MTLLSYEALIFELTLYLSISSDLIKFIFVFNHLILNFQNKKPDYKN